MESKMEKLTNRIYDWIQKDNGYKTNKDNFGPSAIGGCNKQLAYKKLGKVKAAPIEASGLLKMDGGTIYHESYLPRWKEAGFIHTVEKEGSKEIYGIQWKYFIDGIGTDDDGEFVLEYKTIYGRGFSMIEIAPKIEHVYQTLLYMKAEDITRGVILYHGRDNGLLRQYIIDIKDSKVFLDGKETDYIEKFMKEIAKLKTTREFIDKDELPPADFQLTLKKSKDGVISQQFQKNSVKYKLDWHCGYCSFYDACKGKEIKEFMDSTYSFIIDGVSE